MRIGLIARCETSRGLAIQSHNFYLHMPVERVLLVRRTPSVLDCEEAPEWYPGATHVYYDHINHTLPEREVADWMDGLDVIFTVETTYDWRLPDWARRLGVKTVIQGNPEFFRHDQDDGVYRAQPSMWWWPTTWRMDRLPVGRHVPVPMPDRVPTARQSAPPRFLHVVGKRAFEDRNGTDVVINALRSIEEPCDFTISGFGWELGEIALPTGCPVRLAVERAGVVDRWSMYEDHSLLVLPRRYAGLSLPALEAAACGLGVMMPSVSPNQELATIFSPARSDRSINLACGRVPMADVDFRQLGQQITELIRDPQQVFDAQRRSLAAAPRWSEYREIYMKELEIACQT